MDSASKSSVHARASRWHIEPERLLSRHFQLYHDDELVTKLTMGLWREGSQFTIAGHAFAIVRKSVWKDGFYLKSGEEVLCDVKRPFWSRRFELSTADQAWTLERAGWFTNSYRLLDGERIVGTIAPLGWFTRKRAATFEEQVPPPIQVLAIFLVLVAAERDRRSSG
jgi:hypothetical protein